MATIRTRIVDLNLALHAVDEVLEDFASPEDYRWQKLSPLDHIDHVISHAKDFAATDEYDDLTHAAVRGLMALEQYLRAERAKG